jgi:site-specific recombinase XerD
MPTKLTTTISKIACIPNSVNSELVNNFYEYMKSNGASERHQNNNLKVMLDFAKFLGTDVSFYDVQKKAQIMAFLDTKVKNTEQDPDKKWITTWNHNLHRIKHFFRWLYNYGCKKRKKGLNN